MQRTSQKSRIHDHCVLVLNRNWQAIAIISPADAFSHMATENADALDIDGDKQMSPVSWKDWLNLEVRENDLAIGTATGSVRAPTIIILKRYAKVPFFKPKLCLKALWLRDGGICQYSGKQLKFSEASIDHVMPVSRGGPTTWENCVLAEKMLNSRKGAKTPQEAGLRLRKKPIEPKPIPITLTLKNTRGIPEWNFFLSLTAA